MNLATIVEIVLLVSIVAGSATPKLVATNYVIIHWDNVFHKYGSTPLKQGTRNDDFVKLLFVQFPITNWFWDYWLATLSWYQSQRSQVRNHVGQNAPCRVVCLCGCKCAGQGGPIPRYSLVRVCASNLGGVSPEGGC